MKDGHPTLEDVCVKAATTETTVGTARLLTVAERSAHVVKEVMGMTMSGD